MSDSITVTDELIDESKVGKICMDMLETGLELLKKDEPYSKDDHSKAKMLRYLSSPLSNAVILVQQRTARERQVIVRERMEQMGFGLGVEPKRIAPIKKK
jgi:hypothetical protein